MADSLKLLSVNVRGLGSPIKRKRVLTHILKSGSDVVLLQETHHKEHNKHPLSHPKFPLFFAAPGASNSRGVAILISKSIPFTTKTVTADPKGRYIIVTGKIEDKAVTLASIYVPNVGQLDFITDVLSKVEDIKEGTVIIGGDFNYVMDSDRDKSHQHTQSTITASSPTKLQDLITKFGLCDIWRLQHGSQIDYTYYSPRHQVFSRIDYFLIDMASVDRVSSCEIGQMHWTDHAWLDCTFRLTDTKDYHRRWTFDNNILFNDYWKGVLEEEIADYFTNNETAPVAQSTLWDAMKAVVRGKAIAVAATIKKQREEKRKLIIDNIKCLEESHKTRGSTKVYAALQAER